MRVVSAQRGLGVRVLEADPPECAEGQVLIRASCSLISPGTELFFADRCARGELPDLRLGYCSSGIVERVGAGVTELSIGDRVIALGWQHAVHAEWIAVPQRLCLRAPRDLPLEEAVFGCLAATAVHAGDRARLTPADRVLVLGAGLLGQLTAQWIASLGSQVWLAEPCENRLQAARAAGLSGVLQWRGPLERTLAALPEGGMSAVFLCMGGELTSSLPAVLSALSRDPDGKRRGRLVVVGRIGLALEFNADLGNVDIVNVARCGLGYRDAEYELGRTDYRACLGEGTVDDNLRRALRAIQNGALRVKPLRTCGVSLLEAEQLYPSLREHPDRFLGVTLQYPSASH